MKKFISLILCLILGATFAVFTITASADETKTSDPVSVANETIKSFCDTENNVITKQNLYDIFLNKIGYVFEYKNENSSGFGILIKEGKDYFVNEFFTNAENPYKEDSYAIYGGMCNYIEYIKGEFFDAISGKKISENVYADVNTMTGNEVIKVNYTRKEESSGMIDKKVPFYYGSSYNNSCANIAGGNILGYYDATYPEIIPDFDAYQDGYFARQTTEVTNVIDQLYYDMETNIDNGTSFDSFKSGLTTYLNRVGRHCSFTSVCSGGTIIENSLISKINQNIPIALFLDKYNAIDLFLERSGYDQISTNYYSGTHVMVAYGYRNISYYLTETKSVWSPVWYNPFRYVQKTVETNTRNDKYLNVATGMSSPLKGYIRLYNESKVDHAIAIQVY